MVTVDPGTAYGSPVQKFSKREPEGRGTIRTSHMLALADKAEEETMGPGRHEGALARKKIRKRIRNFESKLLPPISRVLAGLRQVNAWIFFGDRTLGTEKKKFYLILAAWSNRLPERYAHASPAQGHRMLSQPLRRFQQGANTDSMHYACARCRLSSRNPQ